MINRRSLRIKAFKNLYSFESCKGANYLMGLDLIDKKFSPDLNSMDIVDKDELDRKKALALEEFDLQFEKEEKESDINPEVEKEVKETLQFIQNLNQEDLNRLTKDILNEATRVINDHLLIISLLEEFAFQNKKFSDEKKSLAIVLGEKALRRTNFYDNKVVAKLKNNNEYQKLKMTHKVTWANHEDDMKDWYKVGLNKDETFNEYIKKESTNYEEDWEILNYICREVIFKNDIFISFFEEIDLDWSENKPIVRSLVLKTIKSVKNESDDLQVADISYNWEDDSEYIQELFKLAARENDYLESLLKGKLQNWDIKRIAMTDRVLLKLALAELIYFPSIPTKVTINEFIEISKTFSTPKSKKFVNGILDGLTAELVEQGIIKKSGRGLIDNK